METDRSSIPLIMAATMIVGVFIGYSAHGRYLDRKAYNVGFAEGKAKCDGPSRLERAGKWLAE